MEIVEKMPFGPDNRTRYPWETWLDGQPRKATRNVDFMCSPKGFAAAIYRTSFRKHLKTTVIVRGDDVYFQSLGLQ